MTHPVKHMIDWLMLDALKAAPVFSNDGLNRPRDWWVKCKEKYFQARFFQAKEQRFPFRYHLRMRQDFLPVFL
ncbi:hypothetical protein PSCICM_22320 [Pseudomonas cichorii]|nr:hypothetical protein PSCICM_22320 [Pseudomonas cichorii]